MGDQWQCPSCSQDIRYHSPEAVVNCGLESPAPTKPPVTRCLHCENDPALFVYCPEGENGQACRPDTIGLGEECDWGSCDRTSVGAKWAERLREWLPVCDKCRHLPEPTPPVAAGEDCHCGCHHFDAAVCDDCPCESTNREAHTPPKAPTSDGLKALREEVAELKGDIFTLTRLLDDEPALDTAYLKSMGWEREDAD